MKTIFVTITILLISSNFVFGQTKDSSAVKTRDVSLDIGAFYTPFRSTDLFGLNCDFKVYLLQKFATGFSASISSKKINASFQYTVGQPYLYFNEFGWINQYDVVQADRIRIGVNLNNGILISQLGDNDIKERYWTKYGYTEKAKTIATDYLYVLEPGIDLSLKIFSNKHNPDIYFTTKAKYRTAFGNPKFGSQADYNNYYLGASISIIGFSNFKTKR